VSAQKLPVIVILGPTAVGKTALSIDLCLEYNGEVVNQDSRQVYRYMDIGTAKPTREQQAKVRHHCIDLVNPDETWTLAQQQELSYRTIDSLLDRHKVPFVVGGTGQYLKAIIEGWNIPRVAPNPEIRDSLRAIAKQKGTKFLHDKLRSVDPVAAERILPGDLRRIIRALEVFELTERPISELQSSEPPKYDFLILGLTMDRSKLYERIENRTKDMLRRGLLEEIQGLLDMGYGWDLPSMQSIGYGDFQPYFEGRSSLEECLRQLSYHNHKLVRHQYVWFRKFRDVNWFDPTTDTDLVHMKSLINRHLS